MTYASAFVVSFRHRVGIPVFFIPKSKITTKMENYFTQEMKAQIHESLYKIRRVSIDFEHALSTGYSVIGRDEFYRCFVRQLSAEVHWLENRLNGLIEEGGAR